MKKSIYTLLVTFFAFTASAQNLPTTSADERAKANADHLRTTLSLNEKQYAKVYKAYLKLTRRQDKRLSQNKADYQATQNTIKGLLTPEQAQRFEQHNALQISPEGIFSPRKETPIRIPEPIRRDPRRTNMYIDAE